MPEENAIRDRVTRAEERLIAEQSVRKTRDDQLFRFISEVHTDLEKQQATMRDLNDTLQTLNTTLSRMSDKVETQTQSIQTLQKDTQGNRDRIQEINGSVRTIKWIWPIFMTLLGVILTLFVANIDLRLEQDIKASGDVKITEEAKSNE